MYSKRPPLIATFHPQVQPEPKFQAGTTNPYINETVTYIAELVEEAIRKKSCNNFFASLSST